MYKTLLVTLVSVVSLTFSSCKKEDNNADSGQTTSNFFPLKVGNYWIYERFQLDTAGNATALGIYDSCYIEKDTVINGNTCYILSAPGMNPGTQERSLYRDSAGLILNYDNRIWLNPYSDDDTLEAHYYYTPGTNDTVVSAISIMDLTPISTSTVAGNFNTINRKTTVTVWPISSFSPNPRYQHCRFADNVGIVTEILPFYTTYFTFTEKRLVRYHLN